MELMRSRSLTAGVMGMRSSIVLIMWIGHNFEVIPKMQRSDCVEETYYQEGL